MRFNNPSDDEIRLLLKRAKTFAVVGASLKAERPSNDVMRFLQVRGYVVRPVNPGVAGKSIHGETAYADLASVPAPVDVIDIFRSSAAALEIVQAAIAEKDRLGASVIWMQLGVINDAAAELARAHGFTVVMNRCPKIELSRLG
ncbi:CoA-binding protein [Hyphomicrobium methylovorum]|uniref:CoA-binding protein n=1 Tax=Hyphomicrobium methylovorum TaxID=84 RepID=UPI0015E6B6F9|nr:CoA-binding protein [Hyphomicrobium methylovorum]MBA2127648.1 CoA-binding protein [Hyphomicrobium methylovorum]